MSIYDEIRNSLRDFYTDEEIETWMRTPQTLLGDKSANELIYQGQTDKVRRVIEQLASLVYL